jgi:hypothetical protein
MTRRTIELVYGVAAEQRRRERLGRYFSPQVAARVESLEASAGELRTVASSPTCATSRRSATPSRASMSSHC